MSTIELKKPEREITFNTEKPISDITAQKRCYIAELTKNALTKFFADENINVSSAYSLYNLPLINEELNIIDFEINTLSVHVIPTIDRAKNINVYLPRIYRIYNIKPDIVLFVNFSKALTKMDITGFTTNIDLSNLAIPKVHLKSTDELINVITNMSSTQTNISESTINTTKELMLAFIENSLSEEGRLFFIKNLINSKNIRKNYKLFYALNCDFISIAKTHAPQTLPVEQIETEPANFEDLSDSTDVTENPVATLNEEEINNDIYTENIDDIYSDYESTDIVTEEELSNNTITEPELAEEIQEEENQIQIIEEPTDLMSAEIPDIVNDEVIEKEPVSLNETTDMLTEYKNDDFDIQSNNTDEEVFDLSASDDEGIALNPLEEDINIPNITNLSETDTPLIQPEETIPEINTISQIQEEQNEQQELSGNIETTEENITDNSGDNLFDFLENMAEASSQNQEQITMQQMPMQEPPIQQTEQTNDFSPDISTIQEEVIAEETQPMPDFNNNINDMNMAFDTTPQPNQQIQTDIIQPAPVKTTAKKSPLIPVLLIVLLAAGGYNLYMHKDTLLSKFNKSEDIQGLTEEKDGAIPPPIDSATLDTTGANTGATADVPPPPTPTANTVNTQNPEQLPALPNTVEPPKPKNLNDAIATALSKDYSGVRISKVSWEVSETLASNPSVSRYLTIAGKSIKNSLSQDLAAATEPSFKDNIAVTITYKKDGSIVKAEMATSSGSTQIDDIVLKSVKDTLGFIKMPALNLNKAEYQTKLLIRL